MRPICVTHGREMPASITGYLVQINDANGKPYQIWSGDCYTCPEGGESVVTGMGQIPVVEHFEPQFATWQARVGTVVA